MAARDAEMTRAKLLDAARHEFAEKGIAGARVDAIARRAGVNKQLVYYYFQSKDGLFRALLAEKLRSPVPIPSEEDSAIGERMAMSALRHLDDPEHVRLLMWEALEAGPGGEVADEDERAKRYQAFVDGVRAAQAAGEVPDDLDPEQVVLSRLAQAMFPVAFPQLTRLVTGRSVDDPEFRSRRSDYLRTVYQRPQPRRDT